MSVLRWAAAAGLAMLASSSAGLAQDAAAGEKVFAKCRACHQMGPTAKNTVGPPLNGMIGRKAGTYEGYNYSPVNKESGLTWDEATFAEYIENPQAKLKGTKMVFPGLKNPQEVKDIIAFLKQFKPDGSKE